MPADPSSLRLRWVVCGLLFFATTVNYIDRQLLAVLKPVLQRELHWTDADFGWVVAAFTGAYALMMPLAGRFIDWLGTRLGYPLAVLLWSLASMSHSLARSAWQFAAARFALGIGESANFPAAVKTIAQWFPSQERALANGIFNSGTNVGAIIAPLLAAFVAVRFGWRATFLVTGALDLVWIAAWLGWFRMPTPAERAYLQPGAADKPGPPLPASKLLRQRAAWAFIFGKFLTDPVWWFYLFWIPGFLNRSYGVNLSQLGPPLVAIYLAADAGSIGGGWLSSSLIKRGWPLNKARKTAMLICACCVLPLVLMPWMDSVWPAVALISLATAAHQGFSTHLFTLVSDTFPASAVASVVGLGGLAGSLSGVLIAPAVGYWLDFSGGAYRPLFVAAAAAYLLALAAIHALVPRLDPVSID